METIINNYIQNDKLRHKLNELTQKTFGFDFENWVIDGYCEDQYIPYSIEENDKIVANVSANIMNFTYGGNRKNFIQIGTVMTDEKYRKMGYGRKIIERVIDDYKDYDGIYLFANDRARGFYDKIGFKPIDQYEYSTVSSSDSETTFKKVDEKDEKAKRKYIDYARNIVENSGFSMDNYGLLMFWTKDMYNIFYSQSFDCFIAADVEDDVVKLNYIVAKKKINIIDLINDFCSEGQKVILGFMPDHSEINMFDVNVYHEENSTLYYMGSQMEMIKSEKLSIPTFSHA